MFVCIAQWTGMEADAQRDLIDEEYLENMDHESLDIVYEEPEGEKVGEYIVTQTPLQVWKETP